MSQLPTKISKRQFERFVKPHLCTAKRGFESKIGLDKVFNLILFKLKTGCQWYLLPVENQGISWHAVYYHFRKWCKDGSWERLWRSSLEYIICWGNLSEMTLDGTHTFAKRGGEKVAYQGRKKAKTCNQLVLIEENLFVLEATKVLAGNHHDAFELEENIKLMMKKIRSYRSLKGLTLHADKAFDSKKARKCLWNLKIKPNIPENVRNRKKPKRGKKRHFNEESYKKRMGCEKVFAWLDSFRHLAVRYDRNDRHFLGASHLGFFLVNMRNVLTTEKFQ